jgi:hypothetical protein
MLLARRLRLGGVALVSPAAGTGHVRCQVRPAIAGGPVAWARGVRTGWPVCSTRHATTRERWLAFPALELPQSTVDWPEARSVTVHVADASAAMRGTRTARILIK